MTTQDESQSAHTPKSHNPTESTPQGRSSNLRSRWKRKGASGNSPSSAAAEPACGEIDPSTLRGTLKPTRHSPAAEASEPVACDDTEPCETPKEACAEKPRAAHRERPRREQGHYNHREEGAEADLSAKAPSDERPRNTYRERAPRQTSESSTYTPRSSSTPRSPITPATYRPTSLPEDTLWSRLKDFFGSLFGSKESTSASRTHKPHSEHGPRRSYTPRSSSDKGGSRGGDRPYRRSGGGSSNRGRGGEGNSRPR